MPSTTHGLKPFSVAHSAELIGLMADFLTVSGRILLAGRKNIRELDGMTDVLGSVHPEFMLQGT